MIVIILSWVVVAAISIGSSMYYFIYKRGKMSWLKDKLTGKGIKMPKMFESKPGDLAERLKAQTEKEVAKAEELRKVLEAKTELAKARAENIRLRRDIDGVSEKSVEKDKQVAEQDEKDAQEAQKVKPRRL